MRVAIFDFDGTIYEGETYQVLMNHLKKHPTYSDRYKRFMLAVLPRYIGAKFKVYPNSRMRAKSMEIYLNTFRDLTKTELLMYFEEVAQILNENYNEQVVNKLKNHIDDGDYVMVVSGAYTQLLQCAFNDLQIDYIAGTNIPFTNENIDQSIPMYHIQGNRKNDEIHKHLKGKDIDWSNSYAYADSYSDLSVLELVGNPVAVQPEEKLRDVAEERNWKVI